ncbi:MAG: hypothetical protein ABIG93_00250 [archaeon]|nr:hypothetical protein [Nanoarchaeota archaeon]
MDLIEKAKEYALSEMDKYGSPDSLLFEISLKKALELAEKLNADKTIVEVGACLMDLKLGQALSEDKPAEHVKMSSEATQEFLNQFDLDEKIKAKIINCVEAHHKKIPFTCIEAEICANADCYRFVHPKGFLRFVNSLGKKSDDFNSALDFAEEKFNEKLGILSLDICKEELKESIENIKKIIEMARKI